jgi:hypothetical protein
MLTFHSSEIRLFTVHGISEIEDAFHLWLESMQARGLSPKSLTGYASEVGQFVRFLREQLNLTELDAVQPHHIRKWLIYRQQHGVSNAQLHNDRGAAQALGRTCVSAHFRHLELAERNRPRTPAPTDGAQRLYGTAPIPRAGRNRPAPRPRAA